jgi:ketosteroid isomerase-like protein
MSQENVEAFKRGAAAYNRGDIDTMLEELDPEIEWHPALQVLLGGEATVYRGHQGVRDFIRDTGEAFTELQAEQSEFRDLGEQVVAIGHFGGRGRESGVRMKLRWSGWSSSKTGRRSGRANTSFPPRPSKPPGCRSRRCRRRTSRF